MPFRDLNEMDTHDGTNHRFDFGGPYDIRVMLNGDDLYRGKVGKADALYISYIPMGETEPNEPDAANGALDGP